MAPLPWGNKAQREFLVSRLDKFAEAQSEKNIKDFWIKIEADFFSIWPTAEAERQSITKGEKKVADTSKLSHDEWHVKRKKNIYNWFNNHSLNKPNRGVKDQEVKIDIPPTAGRIPSELNLYSRKYYTSRVKPLFDEIVGKRKVSRNERISLIARLVAQKYKSEIDDIKNEIRALRDEEVQKKMKALEDDQIIIEGGDNLTPEQYMIAQSAIGTAGLAFGKGLKKRSGWVVSIYVAGPDVLLRGKTSKISIHIGVDEFGRSFRMAYPQHEKNIMDPFTAFADSVFKHPSSREKFIRRDSEQNQASTSNTSPADTDMTTNGISRHVDETTDTTLDENPLFPQLMDAAFVNNQDKPLFPQLKDAAFVNNQDITWDEIFPDGFTPEFEDNTLAFDQAQLDAGLNSKSVDDPLAQFDQQGLWSGNNAGLESNAAFAQPQLDVELPQEQRAASTFASAFVESQFSMMAQSQEQQAGSTPPSVFVQPQLFGIMAQPQEQRAASTDHAYNQFLPQERASHPYGEFGIQAPHQQPVARSFLDQFLPQHNQPVEGYRYEMFQFSEQQGEDRSMTSMNHSSLIQPPLLIESESAVSYSPKILLPPRPEVSVSQSSPIQTNPTGALSQALAVSQTTVPTIQQSPPAPASWTSDPMVTDPMVTDPITGTHSPQTPIAFQPPGPTDNSPKIQPAPPVLMSQPPLIRQSPVRYDTNDGCMEPVAPIPTEAKESASKGKEKSKSKTTNDESALILEGPRNRKSAAPKDVVPLTEKYHTNGSVTPEWFTTAKAYLSNNIPSTAWSRCIEVWTEFESKSNFAGTAHRINAQSRPELLSRWVPNRKYHIIPEVDDKQQFAKEWLTWWNSLQPIWRRNADEKELPIPLSHEDLDTSLKSQSKEKIFAQINKAGPTGIVMVLVGLKLWATLDDHTLWSSAVDDVAACLQLLTSKEEPSQPSNRNSKRKSNEPSAPKPRTKKAKVV